MGHSLGHPCFQGHSRRDSCLVDVSDIFIFFCSGSGKGESEAQGREGWDFLLKIPGGGGSSGEEGLRCREGVCGELGNFEGGGAKYFFLGAEMSTKTVAGRGVPKN